MRRGPGASPLNPSLTPAERDGAGPIRALLHQGLVELPAWPRVDGGPAVLAVILKAGDVGAEEGSELAAAPLPLALVAHLVVEHVGLDLDPLVDVAVLQLHEARADGGDVALLVAEGHPAGALGVLELGVSVDPRVANAAVQPVHDHGQLHCFQWPRHAPDEHGLPGVQRHGGVQDEVGVGQAPRPDLHRLVLDGRRGHAQVELVIVHDARLDQLLHRALVLEQEEGVALRGEVRLALGLVGPVHDEGAEPPEAGCDLILVDVWRQPPDEHLPGEALAGLGALAQRRRPGRRGDGLRLREPGGLGQHGNGLLQQRAGVLEARVVRLAI